jgi:hypothetical protein
MVYKKYEYAVLPSNIDAYLILKRLYSFIKDARRWIIVEIIRISGLIKNKKALQRYKFLFLVDISEPITVLVPL